MFAVWFMAFLKYSKSSAISTLPRKLGLLVYPLAVAVQSQVQNKLKSHFMMGGCFLHTRFVIEFKLLVASSQENVWSSCAVLCLTVLCSSCIFMPVSYGCCTDIFMDNFITQTLLFKILFISQKKFFTYLMVLPAKKLLLFCLKMLSTPPLKVPKHPLCTEKKTPKTQPHQPKENKIKTR